MDIYLLVSLDLATINVLKNEIYVLVICGRKFNLKLWAAPLVAPACLEFELRWFIVVLNIPRGMFR